MPVKLNIGPPANRPDSEQRALLDGPTNLLEKNRLSDSFEQMFELAPVN